MYGQISPIAGVSSLGPLAVLVDHVGGGRQRSRQFFAGSESRYVGTALRAGRRSGVADARAIGSDGKVAIIARSTTYRC